MSEQKPEKDQIKAEALREAATALGHVYQADSPGVTAAIRFLRDRADRMATPPDGATEATRGRAPHNYLGWRDGGCSCSCGRRFDSVQDYDAHIASPPGQETQR